MPHSLPPRIAAVIPAPDQAVDSLLLDFARSLQAEGWRVRGLTQVVEDCPGGCVIALEDLETGARHTITQDLGAGSQSCRIDAGQVADASAVMRRIAAEGADLAIFNRFGGLESAGGGFSAEMLLLMTEAVPVLTVVAAKHLEAWRRFTGEFAIELPPERAALVRWFAALHS